MKTIQLDLSGCKSLFDLHERIRIAFDFPEWYGANWDAFWDLLWSECDADQVIITGEHTLPTEFDKSLNMIHEILEDKIQFNKKHHFNPFSYQIIS